MEEAVDRLNRENRDLEEEIENIIVKSEQERLAEIAEHEKQVKHLQELNADYQNDLCKQLSAPTNAQK